MAREEECRRCFSDGASTARRRVTRVPLMLFILCTLLAGSLAVAVSDDSYYSYAESEGQSSIDYRSSDVRLISDDGVIARRRRATPDSPPMTEAKSEPEKTELEPRKPKESAIPTKLQEPEPRSNQSVYLPQPNAPVIRVTPSANTTSMPVEFKSVANSTSETTTTSPSATVDATSAKPESKKKSTVPQTTNPATTAPAPHVWANRTMWSNVSSVKESDASKNQTKLTELAPVSNTTEDDKSDSDISDISISKFSDVTNTTLSRNNITKTVYDTHQYYNSTFIIDTDICKKYWVNVNILPELKVNPLLSKSHRRAATVKLKFDFPFYGHKVRNITIATGGFLYTGEYVHSWLAATQYIAPLMANFDTRLSNSSLVKYADNGTAFTVEWEKVVLQDKQDAGAFTFQVTLHQNGDIVFVYSVIPLVIEQIEDTMHPVKVGLSDAYIMDRTVFFVRRKTIYEYHRVNFNRQDIMNCTVIYLKALPTCLDIDNCRDCLTKVPDFDCKWCPELNQCSTGTFRSRQDWLLKGCDVRSVKEANSCPAQITTFKGEEYDHDGHVHPEEPITANEMSAKQERPDTSPLESSRDMNMSVSGIIGILTVIALVVGLAGWGAYAYRNPHSASGQMLIRYRPSQWSWRRGEARYTAATIHM